MAAVLFSFRGKHTYAESAELRTEPRISPLPLRRQRFFGEVVMNRKTAELLLIVFGNLLIMVLGAATTFLFGIIRQTVPWLAAMIVIVVLHGLAVKRSRGRFKRLYGVSAKRYMLLGVLPAAVLCALAFIAINVLIRLGIDIFLLPYIDSIPLDWGTSLCALVYSVFFAVIQCVIIAREIL